MISYYTTIFKPIVMKKIFTLLLIVPLFSFYPTAQINELVKYLPEKAGIVIDIDGSSLSQKMSWKELMTMKMFDSLLKKAEPGTRKMITDPSETGINFRDHLYLVFDFAEDAEGFLAFYGKVLDENKLSTLLNKARIKEVMKKTSGENKMIIGKDFVFGWNKTVFVLHAGADLKENETNAKQQTLSKKEQARLEKKCNELLTIKTKNIYSTNKHFENLVKEKADMRIWVEMEKMNGFRKGKNPFSMFGIRNDYQGKYKTAVVNFEDGKIVSKGYTYYSDEISASIQKMYAEKLNTELIKKIPAGNLLGLWSMSFNPDAISELLEKTGIWKELMKAEEEMDFDPGIFLDNLKGDILFSVSMPDPPQEISEEGAEKNPFAGMQVYFAATVKDEKKVNRLIDSLKLVMEEKKKARKENEDVIEIDTLARRAPVVTFPDSLVRDEEVIDEEVYTTQKNDMFKNLKPAHKVENGVFIFSLNDKHLEEFGASTTPVYDKIINEYGNYPMLLTIDLKTIFSIALSSMQKARHYEEDAEMYSFFEVFDKWVIAGGKFENGRVQTMQEIKFASPGENSLKQIMKMFDLVFQAVTRKTNHIELKDN